MNFVRVIAYSLLLFLICGTLRSDGCRNIERLLQSTHDVLNPQSILYLAATQGSQQAADSLGQLAAEQQQSHWLALAATLNSADAFFSLAMYTTSLAEQKMLLTQAAELGHADSQLELALLLEHAASKVYWLEKSAEQGNQSALIALYQWHLMHNDDNLALPWLVKASEFDGESALLYARMLWRLGDHQTAVDVFKRASSLGQKAADNYLTHVRLFWYKRAAENDYGMFQVNKIECAIRIQMVATTLTGVTKASAFVEQYRNDKRLTALPVCINAPLMTKPGQIECNHNWQGSKRLGCDELAIERVTKEEDFSHVVIIAESGKANVYNGIMYLDLADTYDVFVHELAHFAGFVDEYPLSSGLAQRICTKSNAPNLITATQGSNIKLKDLSPWFALSDTVDVSRSRTCNNHPNDAFKPVSEMTFMEFYDQGNIPPLYFSLWLDALNNTENLVPASVNFAQANEAAGNKHNAENWWRQYQQYTAGQENKTSNAPF